MMEDKTIGECLLEAIRKSNAEMKTAYEKLCSTDGFNNLVDCRDHMALAIDAIVEGADSMGGIKNVLNMLETALEARGIKVSYDRPLKS